MSFGPPHATTRAAVIALLEWYAEAGIDAVLVDAPRDRFAETAAEADARTAGRARPAAPDAAPSRDASGDPPRDRAPSMPPPPRAEPGESYPAPRVAVPDEIAIADARERARSAQTLDALREALASFEGCNLRLTAKTLVFGDGPEEAEIMLVGEAPGRDEDIAGVPFVGKSGQLLNRMLAAIGIAREEVRVTNTVPWRPPGNRPPTPAETEMCLPFVARQVELVRPKLLVCLGSPAAKAMLGTEEGILKLRGRWQTYTLGIGATDQIPALPMLHPAYLLRQPAQKRLAWRDLLALKERMAGLRGEPLGSAAHSDR